MATPDSGLATPSKFEAHWPSQRVDTVRATSGTVVRDLHHLLLLLGQVAYLVYFLPKLMVSGGTFY